MCASFLTFLDCFKFAIAPQPILFLAFVVFLVFFELFFFNVIHVYGTFPPFPGEERGNAL